MNEQTISDIIRGMQYAVNTAENMLTARQMEKLSSLFDADGKPKMQHITLPDGRQIGIPIASLTPTSFLSIGEIEMEFAVKISNSVTKGDGLHERTTCRVSFIGTERKGIWGKDNSNGGIVRIKMKFNERNEPESIARIREILDSTVG